MATERKKRQERRERRQQQATPLPPDRVAPAPKPDRVAPAPKPSNRGTFRVAQANRQLALDLPDLIRAKDKPKHQGAAKRSPSATSEAPRPDQGAAKRSPSRDARRPTASLSMDKPDPRLKCRPKDSRPKGGAGSGRSFIAWGDC